MATGSVIKGSSVLVAGRVAGMIGGFLLFLLLARRSAGAAGEFRVAVTYLTISESLPLLGMHRWLSSEIAQRVDCQSALFAMACRFATGVAILCGLAYFAIAYAGIYGPDTSDGLKLVALATVASAINLCVLSALIGLGFSDQAGMLSLVETLARSAAAILLVIFGASLFSILLVFLLARCGVAAAGYAVVQSHIAHTEKKISGTLQREFLSQVQFLAASLIGFLTIRTAGMLLLPLLSDESAAGFYAAPFQLFDMALLVPTVLSISTNYIFVASARRSVSALRLSTNLLTDITSMFVLPVAVLGFVLARPVIETLFGPAFDASIAAFRWLLVGAVIVSFDQILALSMAVSGRYSEDRTCVVIGAVTTVVASCLLIGPFGATGAAMAFLAGSLCTLLIRLRFMRWLVRFPLLADAVQYPAGAALVAGIAIWSALQLVAGDRSVAPPLGVLLAVLGGAIYGLGLYWSGALSPKRLRRARNFMTRRR
jgi:O-antigen/teichoic acid export membrane protein